MSAAPPGTYPGNTALPKEVRDKILSTFKHTLNLYKEGKAEDCQIGCDFILKMDPRFAPARQLMEKAKNPASEVDVAALETVVAEAPVRAERPASTPETDRLLVRAAESFNTRDFDAAIATAEQVLQVLPGNQPASEILRKARERKNAQPQFEAARQRAIAALDTQREGEARAALEKMRSLDADHPAVALLERRLVKPAPEPASELGESTNPGLDAGPRAAASPPPPQFDAEPAGGGGLGDLSLDSLSLDDDSSSVVLPPADMGTSAGGPLSPLSFSETPATSDRSTHDSVPGAPNLWSDTPAESDLGGLSLDMSAAEPTAPAPAFGGPPISGPAAPEPPSQQQEIASLLERGDDAARSGNRQQAIEIWSRIFLIDINNADAVGRIERARQEMAEGNKRIVEGLKRGREAFEAGDFTAAREAFLQVLASDESDATARSYLDRIEAELARPSSGLDLAKKTPQSDILSEEMADAAAIEEPVEDTPGEAESAPPPRAEKPRRPLDRRFVGALGAAILLAILVGGYVMLRGRRTAAGAPAAAEGGPSLEHATALFRDGKIPETIEELKQIPRGSPDYARAQRLLASLTKKGDSAGGGAAEPGAGAAEKSEAPAAGPPPEALRQRQEAEKALAEKRYIDALTAFNLAAPAFDKDPTFAQSLGAASEKVSELTPAVKLYNEGEYETAIPILWRIFQADRENQDARSYLVRCYYNQGIGQLQNGLYGKAADSFKEVIAIDPADADATRHEKFAQHYAKGDLDLMGRIYVRHVQQRP